MEKEYNTLSNEEIEYYTNYFKNQKGQKYPCSNQIVLCGIFTYLEKAKNILRPPNYFMKSIGANRTDWYNKDKTEKWRLFSPNTFNMRGYRFYKIKIDKCIDKNIFY